MNTVINSDRLMLLNNNNLYRYLSNKDDHIIIAIDNYRFTVKTQSLLSLKAVYVIIIFYLFKNINR